MTKEEFINNFSFDDEEKEDEENIGGSFVREPRKPIKPKPYDAIKIELEKELELVC